MTWNAHLEGTVELEGLEEQAGEPPRTIVFRLWEHGERVRDSRAYRIARGALRSPELPLPLAYGHATGSFVQRPDIVGTVLEIWDDGAGYMGRGRLAETPSAEEVYELLGMQALSSVSAGLRVYADEWREEEQAERQEQWLTDVELAEVSVVPVPAMQSAGVLEVHATRQEGEMPENQTAPAPEPAAVTTNVALNAENLTEQRVLELLEGYLGERAADPANAVPVESPLPQISGAARGHGYRFLGELGADLNAFGRFPQGGGRTDAGVPIDSEGARDRLGAMLESGDVMLTPNGITMYVRQDFGGTPPTTGTEGAGVVPPGYQPDLLTLLREGRPIANLFAGRPLPETGTEVELPKVSTGVSVDYQENQGDVVESVDLETLTDKWPKATLAGGTGIPIQVTRWTDPSYWEATIEDHIAAYAEKLDLETIVGDGVGTHHTGILNAGATDVPSAGQTMANILAAVGSATAAVYAGSRRWASVLMMHPDRWGWFTGQTDSEGRPLVSTEAPMNPAGLGSPAAVGTLRSLPVVVDTNIPKNLGVGTNEDPIIASSFRDARLYEDSARPAQLTLTFPSTLSTDVSVFGFSALAIRRPTAFAVISGLILS